MKFLDALHPQYGAAQCPDAHVFFDGDGGARAELALDVVIFENYDMLLDGHMGEGQYQNNDPQGDAALRHYPVDLEVLVNGLSGQGGQFNEVPPRKGFPNGIDMLANSPEAMRGIAWLGTVHGLNSVLWFDYLLCSASPGPSGRITEAASQAAYEMMELHPSLTAVVDGSVPRARVTALAVNASLQPWLRATAWSEVPAAGVPSEGVCVHVLAVNAAKRVMGVELRVELFDANGSSIVGTPLHEVRFRNSPYTLICN
jgi:hypothetical protein